MRRRFAFTLIELLIVIAIIAILALIAIPNFLEAQTRSKVARAETDLSDLASSLRAYCSDHNAYPSNSAERRAYLIECARGHVGPPSAIHNTISVRSRYRDPSVYPMPANSLDDLTVLTTPIAYFHGLLPLDPFGWSGGYSGYGHPSHYSYANVLDALGDDLVTSGPYRRYVLLSRGPDQKVNCLNPILGPFPRYDPTNGTISAGDLLGFGN
ncbi:MAG: prepilin-type N-terminal cleavage/methylation domain-containing protein [Candidatus Sumerlaeota bacterium]|nr:prepilin-type N-terminal cleavage/methylation domain-containing protein [Candidatus Sumerlaeota bacterium]